MTDTTIYVYTVTSNKPLALNVGIGNTPTITAGPYPLFVRDQVVEARSCGAAAGDNVHVTMELIDRREGQAGR